VLNGMIEQIPYFTHSVILFFLL